MWELHLCWLSAPWAEASFSQRRIQRRIHTRDARALASASGHPTRREWGETRAVATDFEGRMSRGKPQVAPWSLPNLVRP
jgi:hypothetical protein